MKKHCVIFILFAFLLLSCNKPERSDYLPSTVSEFIGSIDDLPVPVEFRDNDTIKVTEEYIDGEYWRCSEIEVDALIAPNIFVNYDPNAEVVIPGTCLEAASLDRGTPKRVPLKRGAGAISINPAAGATTSRVELDSYTQSKAIEAHNKILASYTDPTVVAGSFTFDFFEVKAKEELELHLKASGSVLDLFGVSSSLTFNENSEYNKYVVILEQGFYSTIFERPSVKIEDFFDSSVTVKDLQKYTGFNNPLTYISSVLYGRKFYLLLESTDNKQVINEAISANFLGIKIESTGGKNISELENLRVKAFSVGGNQQQAIKAITTNFSQLKEFLSASTDIRTGAPISYVVRSVRTDNIVKNSIATRFTYTDCQPETLAIGDPIMWLVAEESNLEMGPRSELNLYDPVIAWNDLSSYENHALFNQEEGNLPAGLSENALKETFDVVSFPSFCNDVSGLSSKLRISGNNFVKSDYTVMALFNLVDRAQTPVCEEEGSTYFIDGEDEFLQRRIRLGFRGEDKIVMSHGNSFELEGEFPSSDHSHGARMITYRFSKELGMVIDVDGIIVAADPTLTEPINEFPGALLGASGDGPHGTPDYQHRIQIREMIAYDKYLEEGHLQLLRNELRSKYGL